MRSGDSYSSLSMQSEDENSEESIVTLRWKNNYTDNESVTFLKNRWNNSYTSKEKESICSIDFNYQHDEEIINLSREHKANEYIKADIKISKRLLTKGVASYRAAKAQHKKQFIAALPKAARIRINEIDKEKNAAKKENKAIDQKSYIDSRALSKTYHANRKIIEEARLDKKTILKASFVKETLAYGTYKNSKANSKLTTLSFVANTRIKELDETKQQVIKKNKEIVAAIERKKQVYDHALNWQRRQAKKLACQIEEDVENTAYNFIKQIKYLRQAEGLPEDGSFSLGTLTFSTLGWFTAIRLFLIRLNSLLDPIKFLGRFVDIFGLSYGLELIIDLVDLIYGTFKSLRSAEQKFIDEHNLSVFSIWGLRLYNLLLDEDEGRARWSRMLNAIIWLALNIGGIMLTGGFSALVRTAPAMALVIPTAANYTSKWLCMSGMIFDVFHDIGLSVSKYRREDNLLGKITDKVTKLQNRFDERFDEYKNVIRVDQTKKIANEKQMADLDLKIQSRALVQKKMEEKVKGVAAKGILSAINNVIVAIGLGLIFFPLKIASTASTMAGAAISMISGSLLTGLGKRLWDKTVNLVEASKKEEILLETLKAKHSAVSDEPITISRSSSKKELREMVLFEPETKKSQSKSNSTKGLLTRHSIINSKGKSKTIAEAAGLTANYNSPKTRTRFDR